MPKVKPIKPDAKSDHTAQPDKRVKEARIQHIMLLMSTGRYVTHVTAAALAKSPNDPEAPGWGLSIGYIDELAAEAARRLRDRLQTDDTVKVATISTLEFIRAQAIEEGDYKHAIQATMAINGIVMKGGFGMPGDGGGQQQQVININAILPMDRIKAAEANAAAVKPADEKPEAPKDGGEPPKSGGAGAT